MLLRAVAYLAIAVALVVTLFPVYWIAGNSFKFDIDIFAVPPEWFPSNPTLKHYVAAFIERPFLHYALNSFIIAVATTLISLVLRHAWPAMRWRGSDYPGQWRHQISFWILSTRMMPPIVTIIPLYLAFNYLDMLNTKPAVVIAYTAFNLPFATWMMKSYFQDLPVELEEAAMVDGDTRWGAFLRVALPLARPGLAATAIFCLIISWNEFLLALILTLTEQSQTLPIGIAGRVTQYTHLLGRDQRRRLHGLHSDHDLRLHRPEASRPRAVLRRRQGLKPWPPSDSSDVSKKFGELRRRRRSRPRSQSTRSSWSCSDPRAAARPRPCAWSPASRKCPPATSIIGAERINDVLPKYRDVAMVFQSYALYPHLTVEDNIGYPLKIRKVPAAERKRMVDEVARRVELDRPAAPAAAGAFRRPAPARGARPRDHPHATGLPAWTSRCPISTPSSACRCAPS